MVRKRAGDLIINVVAGVITYLILQTLARGLPIPDLGGLVDGIQFGLNLGPLVLDERVLVIGAFTTTFMWIMSDQEINEYWDEESEVGDYGLVDKAGFAGSVLLVILVVAVPTAVVIFVAAGLVGVSIPIVDSVYWLTLIGLLIMIYDSATWPHTDIEEEEMEAPPIEEEEEAPSVPE